MGKKIASLLACCAFLWAVSTGSFLLFCRFCGIPLTAVDEAGAADSSLIHYFLAGGKALRLQLHDTWLFLSVFAALGLASALWVSAEKWLQDSKWSLRDVYWMARLEACLGMSALLYGVGTNGVLAKRFEKAASITDLLGAGLILALPVLLWARWHRQPRTSANSLEEKKWRPAFDASQTFLGLDDDFSSAFLSNPRFRSDLPAKAAETLAASAVQPEEWLERTFHEQNKASALLVIDEASEMSDMQAVNTRTEIMPKETSMQEEKKESTANASVTSFREHLAALNASWKRIEEAGREVEEWFRWQQERAKACLERHAGARSHGNPLDLSRDFLEQKLQHVDAEWSAIHTMVQEMNRWLESSNLQREITEPAKMA